MSPQTPATATPGPWRIGEHHAGTICIEADSTPRRITVARVHIFNQDDGEPEANARLIAAAPDLLWQLRRLCSLVDTLFESGAVTAEEDPDAWERYSEADTLLARLGETFDREESAS